MSRRQIGEENQQRTDSLYQRRPHVHDWTPMTCDLSSIQAENKRLPTLTPKEMKQRLPKRLCTRHVELRRLHSPLPNPVRSSASETMRHLPRNPRTAIPPPNFPVLVCRPSVLASRRGLPLLCFFFVTMFCVPPAYTSSTWFMMGMNSEDGIG